VLHHFGASDRYGSNTNTDGASPSGLMLSGNTLYGTADSGGVGGQGTVFRLNTDGTGFTILHSFSACDGYAIPYRLILGTNSDGAFPHGGLSLSGDGVTLYGAASGGGTSGYGTIFSLRTDGTRFKTLHNFRAGQTDLTGVVFTNSDGGYPLGDLVVLGNVLY